MKEHPDKKYIRYQAKVRWCIRYKGCRCRECNKDLLDCPWEADFHHRPGEKKIAAISQILTHHMDGLMEELEKCDLICCRCHKRLHANTERFLRLLPEIEERVKHFDPAKYRSIDWHDVLKLAQQGLSCRQIGQKLNRSERVVRSVLRRLESRTKVRLIPTKAEKSSRSRIADDHLIRLLNEGMLQKDIAAKYGLTARAIFQRVWRLRQDGHIGYTRHNKRVKMLEDTSA